MTYPNFACLGDRARDPITGLTGIVVWITTNLHGSAYAGIQPEQLRDGRPDQVCTFHHLQLEVLDRKVLECVVARSPDAPEIELGDRVKLIISGIEGLAIACTQRLYGSDQITFCAIDSITQFESHVNSHEPWTCDIAQLCVSIRQVRKPKQKDVLVSAKYPSRDDSQDSRFFDRNANRS